MELNYNPYKRAPKQFEPCTLESGLKEVLNLYKTNNLFESFDLIEFLIKLYPVEQTGILELAYTLYQNIPNKTRYYLYQGRKFDFKIKPNERVLDIGSGHLPFPFATDLADFAIEDNNYGRAGVPFKYIEGKPVYQCSVESMPFEDKEFDFIYCSHVLEHVECPEKACKELMRVGKRGYIETPSKAKDLWLNSGKISNHKWFLDYRKDVLTFNEYSEDELNGIDCNILMDMHTAPKTSNEKAFSALIYLKPEFVNTMFAWENSFNFAVNRLSDTKTGNANEYTSERVTQEALPITETDRPHQRPIEINNTSNMKNNDSHKKLKFLQVHTFYQDYLNQFYSGHEYLTKASFTNQIEALLADGFSGIHLFAPYMTQYNYDSQLIIANNKWSQEKWLSENPEYNNQNYDFTSLLKVQIEHFQPDVLYLSDPITFDSKFIRTLSFQPKLIIGWRAADIPLGTDWSEFDIMLSGLAGVREMALKIGARSATHFFPGFPSRFLNDVKLTKSIYDVSFCGQWTIDQHAKRNSYIEEIIKSSNSNRDYSCGLYLSGQIQTIPKEVLKYNLGTCYGVNMLKALKSGKITIDARGNIRSLSSSSEDLALNETINMRIFEATGSGVFLLTEHFENINQYFIPGKEIETFKDKKELIEKIRYYATHDEEREGIAKRGQEKCLNEYSIEKRAKEFDLIIRDELTKNHRRENNEVKNSIGDDISLAKIKALIDNNQIKQALEIIIKIKGKFLRIENLDTLRGICFVKLNDLDSAKQSLREELMSFPQNSLALNILNSILSQEVKDNSTLSDSTGNSNHIANDLEFQGIYNDIKPYTMLSIERLYNLYNMAKKICTDNIEGNFVECGVARGGSSILLSSVIKKYSKQPRKLFSFDTYEGMPAPTEEDVHRGIKADETGWGTGTCFGSFENIKKLAADFRVDNIINPIKGLFQDTLPKTKDEIGDIALLHMDGDWYSSTKAILDNLYNQVILCGIIQVDDYGHWEGCKKAINEFETDKQLVFNKTLIDFTGIYFKKSENVYQEGRVKQSKCKLLNLGCGNRFHAAWENIDFTSSNPLVKEHNLVNGIPYQDESVDVLYHSHLLEHFDRKGAKIFMSECFRVLAKNGIIRVVIPDLEVVAKNYLTYLEGSLKGDVKSQNRYEWTIIEMFDQMVRNTPGGEMLKYWQNKNIPEKDFIIERLGSECKNIIGVEPRNPIDEIEKSALEIGQFRLSGEIHQWMYDRYSLAKLLKEAGFNNPRVCKANESAIPNFSGYYLDIEPDGSIRKPDSLFMEATK